MPGNLKASVSSGCHTSSPFSFFPGCPLRPDWPPPLRPSCSSSSGLSSYLVHHRLSLLSPHPQSACHATPQPLDVSSDHETSLHCHQLCSCLFPLGRPHACLSGKWTAAIGRYTLRRTTSGGQCFGRTRPRWEWSEHTGRICRFASFRRPLP